MQTMLNTHRCQLSKDLKLKYPMFVNLTERYLGRKLLHCYSANGKVVAHYNKRKGFLIRKLGIGAVVPRVTNLLRT